MQLRFTEGRRDHDHPRPSLFHHPLGAAFGAAPAGDGLAGHADEDFDVGSRCRLQDAVEDLDGVGGVEDVYDHLNHRSVFDGGPPLKR